MSSGSEQEHERKVLGADLYFLKLTNLRLGDFRKSLDTNQIEYVILDRLMIRRSSLEIDLKILIASGLSRRASLKVEGLLVLMGNLRF